MSSILRSASFVALLGGFAGAGCMVEGDDVTAGDDQEPSTSEVEQEMSGGCAPWVCGANDPYLSVYFHELSEKGELNAEGLRLLGIEMNPGDMWNVDVVGDQLWAKKAGFAPVTGGGLVGKSIFVKGGSPVQTFKLKIEQVGTTSYYPAGPGAGITNTYRITYTVVGGDQRAKFICNNPGQYIGEYDTLNQDKWTVVLFAGERYDAKSKTIKGTSADWFNIGCAGHVLAKMHLTHHSSVSAGGPWATTPEQRQTMMKMYTADYCGDGTAFTVGGQELGWTDDLGWLPYYYPVNTLSLEARWNKDGPICLESPRLKGTADPLALSLFGPDVDIAINSHCGATRPPTCSALGQSTDVTKLYGAHLVSATP